MKRKSRNRKRKNKNKKQNKRNNLTVKRTSMRRVRQPTSKSRVITNKSAKGSAIITNTELFIDVVAPGNDLFESVSYELNPGLGSVFPWLASIANRYETYRFLSLEYRYIPSVGTGTNGRFMIAPDYDPDDDNSSESKSKIATFDDAISTPVWQEATMRCKKANLAKRKTYFTRSDNPTRTNSKLSYDALQLVLGYSGFTETTLLGELYVKYTISLETPQLDPDTPSVYEGKSDTPTVTHSADLPFKKVGDALANWTELGAIDVQKLTDQIIGVSGGETVAQNMLAMMNGSSLSGYAVPSILGSSPLGTIINLVEHITNSTNFMGLYELIKGPSTSKEEPVELLWTGASLGTQKDLHLMFSPTDTGSLVMGGKKLKKSNMTRVLKNIHTKKSLDSGERFTSWVAADGCFASGTENLVTRWVSSMVKANYELLIDEPNFAQTSRFPKKESLFVRRKTSLK